MTDRFAKFGGINKFLKRYALGEGYMRGVAKATNVSTETIRNDIKRHIGASGFAKLMEQRKKARPTGARKELNIDQTIQHFEKDGDDHQTLLTVLREMKKAGVKLTARLARDRAIKYELPNKGSLQIRIVDADNDSKDHAGGFHRFKVTPRIVKFAFVVFAIRKGKSVVSYVFKTADIKDVQSLNLRLTDQSKYEIERSSKYDYARDNWKILS